MNLAHLSLCVWFSFDVFRRRNDKNISVCVDASRPAVRRTFNMLMFNTETLRCGSVYGSTSCFKWMFYLFIWSRYDSLEAVSNSSELDLNYHIAYEVLNGFMHQNKWFCWILLTELYTYFWKWIFFF